MSDLSHTVELSTERMENTMNKVYLVSNNYDGYVVGIYRTRELAQYGLELFIESDSDRSLSEYGITEYEVQNG